MFDIIYFASFFNYMEKIKLPNRINISNVMELKELLIKEAESADLLLDFSEVKEADMAALQLIWVFKTQRSENEQETSIVDVNSEIKKSIRLLGFYNLL